MLQNYYILLNTKNNNSFGCYNSNNIVILNKMIYEIFNIDKLL